MGSCMGGMGLVVAGGAAATKGQRAVSAQQYAPDAGGSGTVVDGLDRIQRRDIPGRQLERVRGGAQHARLRSHQLAHMDQSGRSLVREAFSNRRGARHDDRPRRHHSCCRYPNNSRLASFLRPFRFLLELSRKQLLRTLGLISLQPTLRLLLFLLLWLSAMMEFSARVLKVLEIFQSS